MCSLDITSKHCSFDKCALHSCYTWKAFDCVFYKSLPFAEYMIDLYYAI